MGGRLNARTSGPRAPSRARFFVVRRRAAFARCRPLRATRLRRDLSRGLRSEAAATDYAHRSRRRAQAERDDRSHSRVADRRIHRSAFDDCAEGRTPCRRRHERGTARCEQRERNRTGRQPRCSTSRSRRACAFGRAAAPHCHADSEQRCNQKRDAVSLTSGGST